MKIFKSRLWAWWELGLVKWSSFLCGIFAGAYWSEIFAPHAFAILAAGLILGAIGAILWIKKMRNIT
ncbi:MAG: hypothetical protein WCT49_02990 [Candidatus Paceibacterota bacterium]|jgi:hypothetical protein|nr:hypothetical protein [Candidatus Paceibacterota bacterium]